jgi:hypothetical protein
MRHFLLVGLCVVGVACNSISSSSLPTAPSAAGAISSLQALASDSKPVEVTFTKWITTYPQMAGLTGGDVPGTYAGEVLRRTPFDNGVIVELDAEYRVIDPTGQRSFTALISGKQNNKTAHAVLNGVVSEGWAVGAQVHVTFDVITPCAFGTTNVCFQGTIRVMPGSAN